MAYTGPIYRGVDYNPTWPGWVQGPGGTQTNDSDFFNDAFASFWASSYQAAPASSGSAPVTNALYRGDLKLMADAGFNLVRLYNWDMSRGTNAGSNAPASDHLNFLDTANTLGLKVVAPVGDYFLNDDTFSWKGQTPDSSYSFSSAPLAIQNDFIQFINSITDPTTQKIHTAIHSIAVGNEGDIGEGINVTNTSASNFLARTNWWIYNLNKQINGTGIGPDGQPAVNGPGAIVPITATFSNGDQGTGISSWFNKLVDGVTAGTQTPTKWYDGSTTFTAPVAGLKIVDPNFAKYYYNSTNVGQSSTTSPFSNGLAATLALYDQQASPWPGADSNVPLMFMEVFTPNRSAYPTPADQATAAVNEVKAMEAYLASHNAGTASSTTNFMGYNYFEFNDEPSNGGKAVGLYQYTATSQTAHTGTTQLTYGTFPDTTFPVYTLTPTAGPTGSGQTLVQAWTSAFPQAHTGTDLGETHNGTAADELFRPLAGNDIVDGAAGVDTVQYGGFVSNYKVSAAVGSGTIAVLDKVTSDGADSLLNIETIQFRDLTMDATAISKTASLPLAQVMKIVDLYTAGLDRAPDALGLIYWAGKLADGVSLSQISKAFFNGPELGEIYSFKTADLVSIIYNDALGRAADAEGAAYWVNQIDSGKLARTDLVSALVAAAKATGGEADATFIAAEEAVGGHFALTQGQNNGDWAKKVLADVNGSVESVAAANALTDAYAAQAAAPGSSELVVQILGLVP